MSENKVFSFTEYLITSYKNFLDEFSIHPNLDSMVSSIQFFSQYPDGVFPLPEKIEYLNSGDLKLCWENQHSKCFIAFENKNLLYTEYLYGEEKLAKRITYNQSFEYLKDLKDLGFEILDFLNSGEGLRAFNNL